MSATTLGQRAATRRWPPLLTSGVCAFYVYVLVWLTLVALAGAALLRTTPLVITSASMEPTIRAGDLVLTTPPPDVELDVGTVIAFRDPSRDGAFVTHRIVEVTDGRYRTQGDSSQAPDAEPVPHDAVVGVGRVLVPVVGLPLVWAQGGRWAVVAVWTAATLLAINVAFRRPRRPSSPAVPADWVRGRPATPASVVATSTAPATPAPAPAPASAREAAPTVTIRLDAPARRPTFGGRSASIVVVVSIALVSFTAGTASAAFTSTTAASDNTFRALTLDPVTGVTASCATNGKSITVTWTPPPTRHDGIEVVVSGSDGSSFSTVLAASTTSSVHDPVTRDVTYTYDVATTLVDWRSSPTSTSAVCVAGGGGGGPGGTPKPKTVTTTSPLVAPVDETSSTPVDETSSTPTA